MTAFQPTGPLLSFTSASSAPSSVQIVTLDSAREGQCMVTNVDGTNDAVIGWGQSDTEAKLNAAAGTNVNKCVYILRNSSRIISIPAGSYVSGIAVASTAVIKVQAGYGL